MVSLLAQRNLEDVMSKRKDGAIRIQANTDNRDIEAQSLGLDCWIVGDSVNTLNANRGLHIQIRHNGNPEVFEVANRVSRLIARAPEMLELLIMVRDEPDLDEVSVIKMLNEVIAKAEGKS
jgi:hypothetical protein